MGLIDTIRRWFRPEHSSSMRDRYDDRATGTDPKFREPTPSGTVGPAGSALEHGQGEGGPIEPDPPKDP
jgi:hypothetical protein